MLEEFKKSVSSILYERATSPFWGAFIASWVAWNWQLVYFTLFVSSDKVELSKLEYLKANLPIDIWNLIAYPLLISFALIAIVPLLSNGAYWISLNYRNWKVNQKIKIENKIPLTVEESIKIRSLILQQEERFKTLTSEKDSRILKLNENNINLEKKLKELQIELGEKKKEIDVYKSDIEKHKRRNKFNKPFSGDWFYELSNGEKRVFRIYNEDRLEFEDDHTKYKMYPLRRYDNSQFLVLLYPETFHKDQDFKIRLIDIRRSKENAGIYEGDEIVMERKEGDSYGSFLKLKIHEA